MKPTALFLFNSSRYAVDPWLSTHHCVSVDYDDTDHSNTDRDMWSHEDHTRISVDLRTPTATQRVLAELLARGLAYPSVVISFAPCTDLAVSGSRHFQRKREQDPQFQDKAVALARMAETFGVPYMVENPVSVLSTMWRKPDVICHPADFGGLCPAGPHPEFPEIIPERDAYYKKTCLWLGHGMRPPVSAPVVVNDQDNPGWKKLGGKSARTKYIRSLTPRGLARALWEANHD